MIRIANPLYDVVFKYLMEDREASCLLLSRLLGLTIVDLEFLPQEQTISLERHSLTVYRLDFSARIKTSDGDERQVLLEVQKAKFLTDILRFREYLGQQYASRTNVRTDAEGRHTALPIISVYILGYALEQVKRPVLKVNRQIRDLVTGETLECTEPFIESLTHDCYIVQVSQLKAPYRNELERLLSIFDQHGAREDRHVLEVDEEGYPEEGRKVLRRLNRVVTEEKVRRTMDAEDDFLEELEAKEREILAREKVIEEKVKVIEEQGRALGEKDRALAEQARLIEELKRKLAGAAE